MGISRYSPRKRKRRGPLRISYSALKSFLDCQRKEYFIRAPGTPKVVDYPRLTGIVVHDHVRRLHIRTKDDRPFYFMSKKSFLNSFWHWFNVELERSIAARALINPNSEDNEKFLNIGRACISNYWDAVQGTPRPLQVEEVYTWNYNPRVLAIGIFDQVRSVDLEYIAKRRPEILLGDALSPEFDPVIILDLKTEYPNFEPKSDDTHEQIKAQFNLHEYYQPAFYTWLYRQIHGKWPIGFLWYHMRTSSGYFTYREGRDFEELFRAIDTYIDGHNAALFPKNVGRHCQWCDYLKICHGDRPFLRSYPEELHARGLEVPGLITLPVKEDSKQLRLKLRGVPRKGRKPDEIPTVNPEIVTLRELPMQVDIPDLN